MIYNLVPCEMSAVSLWTLDFKVHPLDAEIPPHKGCGARGLLTGTLPAFLRLPWTSARGTESVTGGPRVISDSTATGRLMPGIPSEKCVAVCGLCQHPRGLGQSLRVASHQEEVDRSEATHAHRLAVSLLASRPVPCN